jgi:hypothetical protein
MVSLQTQEIRFEVVMRAGRRQNRKGGKPAVYVEAVEVDHIGTGTRDRSIQLVPKARVPILKEYVGLSRHDAPQMIAELYGEGRIGSDRHWTADVKKLLTQGGRGPRQRRGIGLVIPA